MAIDCRTLSKLLSEVMPFPVSMYADAHTARYIIKLNMPYEQYYKAMVEKAVDDSWEKN